MSIKTKATRGGAAIAATLLLTIAITAWGTNRIRLGGELHQETQMMSDFNADILPPPLFLVEAFLEASLLVNDPQDYEHHRANLERLEGEFGARAAHWQDTTLPDDLKQLLEGKSAPEGERFWQEVNTALLPAIRRGDDAAMNASYRRLEAIYGEHKAAISDLVTLTAQEQQQINESAESTMMLTIIINALLALACLGGIMLALRLLKRHALEPLDQTAQVMQRMAAGELDAGAGAAPRDDEIGEMHKAIEVFRATARAQAAAEEQQQIVVAGISGGLDELAAGNLVYRLDRPFAPEYEPLRASFNATLEQLGQLVAKVAATAGSVNNGATEIRAASEDLALRNEQQAASIEEAAAAISEAARNLRAAAEEAKQVQKSIDNAHREATEGGAVVDRAVSAMSAIEGSSQQIARIISVIDGIAFQTNLLALNAGVEAARAGDAGKGFAVVANEVRALAQRSADAARDIKELITNSSEQVESGVALVGEAGGLLQTIVGRVGEISVSVAGIAGGVDEQAAGLQQLNAAVGEMDHMTQQNAAMAEQSTAASRSLTGESAELAGLVASFRTGGQGAGAMPTPARASAGMRRPQPATRGALALAPRAEDDWSEF